MANLLEETLKTIESHAYLPEDIVFIGSGDGEYGCTWEEFTQLANFDYDEGYGGQEIATDLIIVFSNGTYLQRGEYDGFEWWELVEPIKVPKTYKPIKGLSGRWSTLEEIHNRANYDEEENDE